MIWLPFKIKKISKNFLGIDIGTSSIKVVELSRKGQAQELENYGEIKTLSFKESPFRQVEKNTLSFSNQEVASAIKAVLREAEIQTKEVNFSIPDFSSFFTSFELPQMTKKELPGAVKYEARSYIPLPLSEITLDWSVIEGSVSNNLKLKRPLKILVVAVPNEVINHYQEIAAMSNLRVKALEAEAFALSRALAKNEKNMVGIVDIGARSTTFNILEQGHLKISHSFNISGNELTEIMRRSLKIDYEKAEEIKKNLGLSQNQNNIREILFPLIDSIIFEVKKISNSFYQQEGKEIEKIILSGSSSLLPGLKEYFSEELKKETVLANPFSGISYPAVLEETLKELGPSYAIATGLAQKGFE